MRYVMQSNDNHMIYFKAGWNRNHRSPWRNCYFLVDEVPPQFICPEKELFQTRKLNYPAAIGIDVVDDGGNVYEPLIFYTYQTHQYEFSRITDNGVYVYVPRS